MILFISSVNYFYASTEMNEKGNTWYENQCIPENEKNLSIFHQIEKYQNFNDYFDTQAKNRLQEKQKRERESIEMCFKKDVEGLIDGTKEQCKDLREIKESSIEESEVNNDPEVLDPSYYSKEWLDYFVAWNFEKAIDSFEKQLQKDIKKYWPENINVIGWYVNIWVANYKLWRYNEALNLYLWALEIWEKKYPDDDIIDTIHKNILNLLSQDSIDNKVDSILFKKAIEKRNMNILKRIEKISENTEEIKRNIQKNMEEGKRVSREEYMQNIAKEHMKSIARIEKRWKIEILKEQIEALWDTQPQIKNILNGMMELLEESLETKVDKQDQELVDRRQDERAWNLDRSYAETKERIQNILNYDLRNELREIRSNEKLNTHYNALLSPLKDIHFWARSFASRKLESKKWIVSTLAWMLPIFWKGSESITNAIESMITEKEMKKLLQSINNIDNFDTILERLSILITQDNKLLILWENDMKDIEKKAKLWALWIISKLQQDGMSEKLRGKKKKEVVRLLK